MAENKDIKINTSRLTKAEGGNLTPFNSGNTEKEREIQRMGGRASAIAKRRNKTMEQWANYILNHTINNKEREMLEQTGLITIDGQSEMGEELNKGLVVMTRVYGEAIKGNMRAVNTLLNAQRITEQRDESNTTNILEALKESVEKDWETEKPLETPPEANTSPVSNENAQIIEEAIKGGE